MKQWNSQGVENRCFVTAEPDGAQMLAPYPQVVRTRQDHGQVPAAAQRELCEGTCRVQAGLQAGCPGSRNAGNLLAQLLGEYMHSNLVITFRRSWWGGAGFCEQLFPTLARPGGSLPYCYCYYSLRKARFLFPKFNRSDFWNTQPQPCLPKTAPVMSLSLPLLPRCGLWRLPVMLIGNGSTWSKQRAEQDCTRLGGTPRIRSLPRSMR